MTEKKKVGRKPAPEGSTRCNIILSPAEREFCFKNGGISKHLRKLLHYDMNNREPEGEQS